MKIATIRGGRRPPTAHELRERRNAGGGKSLDSLNLAVDGAGFLVLSNSNPEEADPQHFDAMPQRFGDIAPRVTSNCTPDAYSDNRRQLMVNERTNRREFTKRAIAAGVAASCGLAFDSSGKLYAQAGAITDEDILNFALNLEYLEAEFYTVATTGQRIGETGIDVSGRGRQGATTGGAKVALDARVMVVAEQIALDEQAHVKLLRSALRTSAVAKPSINLEALGIGFRTQAEFLTLASVFEDVGVSAYRGAAPLIQSRGILDAAAGIGLTEGQHAGVLRYLVSNLGFNVTVPSVDPKSIPPIGQPEVAPARSGGRLFFVEGLGLSPSRTTGEVLRIVYANNARAGGFFPDGVNGKISAA